VERNPQVNAILFRGWLAAANRSVSQRRCQFADHARQLGDRWMTFIGTVRSTPTKSLAAIQRG
jgi:hypothetical protein